MTMIQKPAAGEYAPYTIAYIDLVPDDGMVLDHLRTTMQATTDLIQAQPAALLDSRCAPNEWTIKEILVHIVDTERVFAYRALRFARNDLATELAGFEQNDYVANADANDRTVESILAEYSAVRLATIAFLQSISEAVSLRMGRVNGNNLSVRAAAYIIAGHELHHVKSITDNYVTGKAGA